MSERFDGLGRYPLGPPPPGWPPRITCNQHYAVSAVSDTSMTMTLRTFAPRYDGGLIMLPPSYDFPVDAWEAE